MHPRSPVSTRPEEVLLPRLIYSVGRAPLREQTFLARTYLRDHYANEHLLTGTTANEAFDSVIHAPSSLHDKESSRCPRRCRVMQDDLSLLSGRNDHILCSFARWRVLLFSWTRSHELCKCQGAPTSRLRGCLWRRGLSTSQHAARVRVTKLKRHVSTQYVGPAWQALPRAGVAIDPQDICLECAPKHTSLPHRHDEIGVHDTAREHNAREAHAHDTCTVTATTKACRNVHRTGRVRGQIHTVGQRSKCLGKLVKNSCRLLTDFQRNLFFKK